jgi:hypothetical protein
MRIWALLAPIALTGILAGCGSSESSSSGSLSGAQSEAQAYITGKEHTINLGRVDYEHVVALAALAEKHSSTEVIDEIAKVAQEAHDQIDGFREELFKTEGDKKLSEATFALSEAAGELKNAMGALVAYTGNPNPATLAHFGVQVQGAQGKWNQAVDEIWEIAHEHNAPRLEVAAGRSAAKSAESVSGGWETAPSTSAKLPPAENTTRTSTYTNFHSPSNNIECEMRTLEKEGLEPLTFCQSREPPHWASVSPDGRVKHGGAEEVGNMPSGGAAIPYGGSESLGPWTCLSLNSGMRCTIASGKGFEISRSGVTELHG